MMDKITVYVTSSFLSTAQALKPGVPWLASFSLLVHVFVCKRRANYCLESVFYATV